MPPGWKGERDERAARRAIRRSRHFAWIHVKVTDDRADEARRNEDIMDQSAARAARESKNRATAAWRNQPGEPSSSFSLKVEPGEVACGGTSAYSGRDYEFFPNTIYGHIPGHPSTVTIDGSLYIESPPGGITDETVLRSLARLDEQRNVPGSAWAIHVMEAPSYEREYAHLSFGDLRSLVANGRVTHWFWRSASQPGPAGSGSRSSSAGGP